MLQPKNKIMIIGSPGSGKSTFARALREKTGLPLHHLDSIYWFANGSHLDKADFREKLRQILQTPAWIIDGNYNGTLEERIRACEQVYFLDFPVQVCLDGIHKRIGQARSDMPWIERKPDAEFLTFIQNFPQESKPKIMSLLERFPEKEVITFHTREESAQYLDQLI